MDQLRQVLDDVEARLSAPDPSPLRPEAAEALVRALGELALRVSRLEREAESRHAELGATLRLLAVRLDGQAAAQAGMEARLSEREALAPERMDESFGALREAGLAPDPGPIRAILAAAGAMAALSVAAAGVLAFSYPRALPRIVTPLVPPTDLFSRPAPAQATGPQSAAEAAAPPPESTPARESLDAIRAALERGDATALARLTGLALAGDVQAQLHLAGLYDAGAAGLPRDMVAARLWTRRAAEGGERIAMHNLGLFLANGEGGPRDASEAAAWFRRGAERGVIDSQYNLGLIYEAGRGVERNLREAYRWFAIAANAGDVASREKAVELEARLKPAERAGLDAEVKGFAPGAPRPAATVAGIIPPATTLAETQALLARQGYYLGPMDGVASPALTAAAAAYLRDHPTAGPSAP